MILLKKIKLQKINLIVLLLLISFNASQSKAAGTLAGTAINNAATVSYSVDGIAQPDVTSNIATFNVDELIDLTLTWQDGAPVSVNTPDTNDALSFLLTNIGNGPEAFSLSRNNVLPGDNYDLTNGSAGSLFLENGLAVGFQSSGPNADTLYVAGVNDPNLAPDTAQIIYLNSNTPAGLSNGNTGNAQLNAASTTAGAAGAAVGTGLPGLGQGGTEAVVGPNQAQKNARGTYLVSGLIVNTVKTITNVLDPSGGNTVVPGSVISYRIQLNISGAGMANNLIVSDPIPANTTYTANSIIVDSVAKTDSADADNVDFAISSPNTITVNFGNTVPPASFNIDFKTTIN